MTIRSVVTLLVTTLVTLIIPTLVPAVPTLAGGVAAQSPPAPQAQSPQAAPPSFRVEVNYVEVDAFVTDAQGKVVTNLTAGDFEVLEDGRPQKVTTFSLVDIPIERAERPLFAAAADRGRRPDERARRGAGLPDRPRRPAHRPDARAAGQGSGAAVHRAELRRQRPRGGRLHERPRRATRRISRTTRGCCWRHRPVHRPQVSIGDGRAALGDHRRVRTGLRARARTPTRRSAPFRARSVMSTIRKLAEFMGGVRGRRKAMMLIGEGVDYDIFQATGVEGSTASSVISDTHDAIAAATRGNVIIYAIDPRGLADRHRGSDRRQQHAARRRASASQSIMSEQRARRTACACSPTAPAGSPR